MSLKRPPLPDPLIHADGLPVADSADWETNRRPWIIRQFEDVIYGRAPVEAVALNATTTDEALVLGGSVIRRQTTLRLSHGGRTLDLPLLMYIPADALVQPVPTFVGLNFWGNHTVQPDPAIHLATSHIEERKRPAENFRGALAHRHPVELITASGYALVTAHRDAVDPDFHDGFANGVHGLIESPRDRQSTSWGTIAAWAWGLRRIADYLATGIGGIDADRLIAFGHSRLGKTALWAGALDRRFKIVIANNSGFGGAAVSRGKQGETIAKGTEMFPHWYLPEFATYAGREEELPIDQHMLIAAVAPRPVYIASASDDVVADPPSEFVSTVAASAVYRLHDHAGLPASTGFPSPGETILGDRVGYHLRDGKHDLLPWDWERFIAFADRYRD